MEHQKSLKTSALISKLSDSVKTEINNLFSNGVVTSGKIVGSVFFSGDQLLRMEKLSVSSSSNLVNDSGFQVKKNSSGDVLSSASLREESVEGIITTTNSFVRWHLTIRLNSVFETEEFPTSVTDLNTSLTNVNGDNLSHVVFKKIITYNNNF